MRFGKKILFFLLMVLMLGVITLCFYDPTPSSLRLMEQRVHPEVHHTQALPANRQIDRLVVFKSQRQMWAYDGDKLLKIYPISLGGQPVGKKQFEGDQKTPEGIYRINERSPHSCCRKNLGISYPNEQDKAYAVAQGKSAGGLIKIHSVRNGLGFLGRWHLLWDWTDGCIAVTDQEIDELFEQVVSNAVIDIRP